MAARIQLDPTPNRASAPAPAPATPSNPNADGCYGPDAPVRIEVEMPRDLYDRLTDHDDAPRCRYDMATGRAEFVAEPGVGHERRAAAISGLFSRIEHMLEDAGHASGLLVTAATRLLSDDGAYEPDASVFLDPVNAERVSGLEGWLDTRKGHPVPDLVAEVDRSVDSSHKLEPYFRMGVREAWTWSRRDGVHVWVSDAVSARRFAESDRSRVLPGLRRDDLDALLAARSPSEASRHSRRMAGLVARTIVAGREAG
jgi:Uma2 family endonuclease